MHSTFSGAQPRGPHGTRHRHPGFDRFGLDGRRGSMGRRGGRGRRTDRGDIRTAILALVAEQPRHGYELIQAIEERSGGNWRPSPGSIYPTVAQLEDEGLVDTEKVEGRRMVTLTAAGTSYVAEHSSDIDGVWEKAGESVDEPTRQLRAEVAQLISAVRQVAGVGTEEQVQAAMAALAEARKTIYRMLAE